MTRRGSSSWASTDVSPVVAAIQSYRLAHGVRVVDMAKLLGVSPPQLIQVVSGRQDFGLRMLQQVAKFFEWTPMEVGLALRYEVPKGEGKKRGKRKARAGP